jgi:hypothetical protein
VWHAATIVAFQRVVSSPHGVGRGAHNEERRGAFRRERSAASWARVAQSFAISGSSKISIGAE